MIWLQLFSRRHQLLYRCSAVVAPLERPPRGWTLSRLVPFSHLTAHSTARSTRPPTRILDDANHQRYSSK